MKAVKILKNAFALAGENYEDFNERKMTVFWLNTAVFRCEKAQLMYEEKHGLSHCDDYSVTDIYDDVRMCDSLCRGAIVYAVASLLFQYRADEYNSKRYDDLFTGALTGLGTCEKPIDGGEF